MVTSDPACFCAALRPADMPSCNDRRTFSSAICFAMFETESENDGVLKQRRIIDGTGTGPAPIHRNLGNR